tara:strand:- start:655 stop:1773 length:1119 start_codon:yes stop_codon:yes gene_type:complete
MNQLQDNINELLEFDPYNLDRDIKKDKLIKILKQQVEFHLKNCNKYKIWYESNNFTSPSLIKDYQDVPFIPSSTFKHTNLVSIKNSKKIQSSGTTSNAKSTIFIDKATSQNQTKSLSKILSAILKNKRKNYFIIDLEPKTSSLDNTMSARQAGMMGYLMGAKSKTYLLTLDYNKKIVVDDEKLEKLISVSKNEPILIIGYTYMLYEYFLQNSNIDFTKINLNLESKIIHFGGWKKLENKRILKKQLINLINNRLNIKEENIYDIYGFTEQLGTIYPSSGNGGSKVSSYSHVLVRDPITLKVLNNSETGFLQFISPLPLSYPGFSILNDDLGKISTSNTDKNNNEILEFTINPRLDNAENRGCGDTLPDNYYV